MATSDALLAAAEADADEDVERGEAAEQAPGSGGMLYPCDLCCCLPWPVRLLLPIPTTYRVMQDVTHMCLLIGFFGGVWLVSEAMHGLGSDLSCRPSQVPCGEEALTFLSVLPCSYVINRLISLYDAELSAKEEEAKKHRQSLEDNYKRLTSAMEGLLTKATQSSSAMAERNFDDHKRDFQRFLSKAKLAYQEGSAEPAGLVDQFRRFVQNWLLVFAECSVDPMNAPRLVASSEELQQCKSVVEVCNFMIERLKSTTVRFISSQRDADAKMLESCQKEQAELASKQHGFFTGLNEGGPKVVPSEAGQVREIELADRGLAPAAPNAPPQQSMDPGQTSGATTDASLPVRPGHHGYCSWFGCGSVGVGCSQSEETDGYPWDCRCICAHVVFLSQDHVTLCLGLASAAGLVALDAINREDGRDISQIRIASASFYMLAILNLLVQYEQIDTVQRLVNQMAELEEENRRVQERHDQMRQFWQNTQQLLDLWVHRTMPRLNLLGEVHEHLEEEAHSDTYVQTMQDANMAIEALESKLPELTLWRQDGGLSDGAKKSFSARLEKLSLSDDLPSLIGSVKKEMEAGLLREDAVQPDPKRQALPSRPDTPDSTA
eukprot:TRINITY_DN112392_c0_g1_i1.p1 TRINITY_DN112392_c0_g1~~TRINITY_DN112392_c0_g1_i1.p1  ORF type:complete len:606 (+),score=147.35 TRINITY_DN112392_c0_g1_i1:195-2012(+)